MLFNERASCTDHPCAQFASAGWQPTGSRQNRQHLGCIPTLFAVIRRSFSQKDKESRHHIGCDGASYKCTQWHFLIRISKNKCSSSNSAKKEIQRAIHCITCMANVQFKSNHHCSVLCIDTC